jgi:chitin-binding protein
LATATTCTLSGLAASTAYTLSVTAVNAIGSSVAATGTATTLAAAAPPSKAPHFGSLSGTPARIGKTVTFTINGSNLSGTSVKSSNAHTTLHVTIHTGTQIKVKVTVSNAQKSNGTAKLTIAGAHGKLVLTYSMKK